MLSLLVHKKFEKKRQTRRDQRRKNETDSFSGLFFCALLCCFYSLYLFLSFMLFFLASLLLFFLSFSSFTFLLFRCSFLSFLQEIDSFFLFLPIFLLILLTDRCGLPSHAYGLLSKGAIELYEADVMSKSAIEYTAIRLLISNINQMESLDRYYFPLIFFFSFSYSFYCYSIINQMESLDRYDLCFFSSRFPSSFLGFLVPFLFLFSFVHFTHLLL